GFSVLGVLRLVLQVVHDDEQVGGGDLRQVADPRQIVRLVRGDDHDGVPPPPATTAPCPRVSQLEECRVTEPSVLSTTYAVGMSTAIGRNHTGCTRYCGSSRRVDGAKW